MSKKKIHEYVRLGIQRNKRKHSTEKVNNHKIFFGEFLDASWIRVYSWLAGCNKKKRCLSTHLLLCCFVRSVCTFLAIIITSLFLLLLLLLCAVTHIHTHIHILFTYFPCYVIVYCIESFPAEHRDQAKQGPALAMPNVGSGQKCIIIRRLWNNLIRLL